MGKETLIHVDRVYRYYGKHCAVNDISFSVARGEVLGFLGPNGAGKTTTMQIVCGVLAASSGEVLIAGHSIVDQAKQAKGHIGFLPEQPPLYPDLSVNQFLDYCARLRGVEPGKRHAAIETSKTRCGLAEVGERQIDNLSRGFQQRVGIAQAIVHGPDLVVLDEPTVGLDPSQIVEIRTLIRELGADHSVILSTHILSEVQSICDRVLIINEGLLLLDQTIAAITADDTPARTFVAALQAPPPLAAILEITGVTEATAIGDGRFRIHHDAVETPVYFAETAATSGWKLYEMVPQRDALEETFLRLTRGAVSPTAGTAAGT